MAIPPAAPQTLEDLLRLVEDYKNDKDFNEAIAHHANLIREVMVSDTPYADILAEVKAEYDAKYFVRLVTLFGGRLV